MPFELAYTKPIAVGTITPILLVRELMLIEPNFPRVILVSTKLGWKVGLSKLGPLFLVARLSCNLILKTISSLGWIKLAQGAQGWIRMTIFASGFLLYGPFPSSQLRELGNNYTSETVLDQMDFGIAD